MMALPESSFDSWDMRRDHVVKFNPKLYRALDSKYITHDQFDQVYEIASECRKQIKGFRRYLRDANRNVG